MYPDYETIMKLAENKEYRRIPVCRELYADRYTPVEVMRILRGASRHCYLLESASQTEVWGRYSFLGYEPTMEITCTDGVMKIRRTGKENGESEEIRKVTHPGDTLREIISQYKSPAMEGMPTFTGGLVGYFSYDHIKYSEPKLELRDETQQDFRDMDLMLFDQVIAFDHYRQKVLLITGVMTEIELEAGLLKDEKELAEHNMLVDLGRNDIGKISKIGTVEVEKYLSVERFSCVMHLGSTVTGTIRDDKDAVDAVDSILPAGTLSGAPKFRACQIIQELEQSKRGIYGGAIGYMDFTGNLDVCIAIRLVYKKNGEICIRSGAGIVADSVPEKEFEECTNKAKAVVRAIKQAEEGLE